MRPENARCEEHANGYGGAFGTHCLDCIQAQREALAAQRTLPPMPALLAEKLGLADLTEAQWTQLERELGVARKVALAG